MNLMQPRLSGSPHQRREVCAARGAPPQQRGVRRHAKDETRGRGLSDGVSIGGIDVQTHRIPCQRSERCPRFPKAFAAFLAGEQASCTDGSDREASMRVPKVGILTFSDGRPHVHNELLPLTREFQERLARRLREAGWEAVMGRHIVWTTGLAKSEGRFLAGEGLGKILINFAILSFPHLAVMARQFAPGPFLLVRNLTPQYSR